MKAVEMIENRIEERMKRADEQLRFWEQQAQAAQQQVWLWKGALEALRGLAVDEAEEPVLEQEAGG